MGKGVGDSQRPTTIERGPTGLVEVPLDGLSSNPHQPRTTIHARELKALALSIQQTGLLQSVLVTQNNCESGVRLVAGHRRAEACRILGWSHIPAVLVVGDSAELALVENVQRTDLHPLDEASGIRTLMEVKGYTQGQVARILGKSRTAINESLKLLDLTPEIQEACRTSDTSKAALLEIARCGSPAEQAIAWRGATVGGLTVRRARQRKRRLGASRKPQGQSSQVEVTVRKGKAFFRALERLSPDGISDPEVVDLVARMHRLVHLHARTED